MTTCSGVRRFAQQSWYCQIHSAGPSRPSAQQAPPPIGPPNQPKGSPIVCSTCKGTIRCNTTPIICLKCSGAFHNKCTNLTRAEIVEIANVPEATWTCTKCHTVHSDYNITLGGAKVESAGMAQSSKTTHSLRILQWNADGLSPTKTIELGHRLSEDRIDICLVQETKWKITKSTPRLTGFTSVRLDRKNQNGGGGLVTYVKSSLVFELLQQASISGTEIMTLRVKLGKRDGQRLPTYIADPPGAIRPSQP